MAVQIGEFEVVPAPQPAAAARDQAASGGGQDAAPPQPAQSAQELRRMIDRMRSRARRLQAD